MFIDKKLVKIFIGVSVLAFVISGCGFFSRMVGQDSVPPPAEALPTTETAPEIIITPATEAVIEPSATPVVALPTQEIGGYDELVNNLKAVGAQVEPAGEIVQPFLEQYNITGKVLKVNGLDVQVFEFTSELVRAVAAGQISEDGYTIATMAIDWADQPNFWAKGRLIVLYVGTDAAMIELLTSVMGEPITSHN